MLKGQIWRDGSSWLAEVSAAGVHTEARSRKGARLMIADAFEAIIHHRGFKVTVSELGPAPNGRIEVLVEGKSESVSPGHL